MSEPVYDVIVGDAALPFSLGPEDVASLDLIALDKDRFHLVVHQQSIEVRLVEMDPIRRTLVLEIEGRRHTCQIRDVHDRLVEAMGLNDLASASQKDVFAPMPGKVLAVQVNKGQSVKEGQHLVILEAMKMENILQAPADGEIKAIHVQDGAIVEKGQCLIEIE